MQEIADGVYSLSQEMGGHVHAFLLDDGETLTLIDTLYDTDAVQILETILHIGRKPSDLRQIVLTHAHRSHIGGLGALKRVTNATVHAHTWEAEIIEAKKRSLPVTWFPALPISVWAPTYILQYGQNLNLGKLPGVRVDKTVEDGDRIGPLTVVHTPGHTPGHLSFHWHDRKIVFAGDTVATWPTFAEGWPAFNLDPAQTNQSVAHLATFEPEIVAVGHGEPVNGHGAEQLRSLAEYARGN